jgi:broad specificity phosphatase PhoE
METTRLFLIRHGESVWNAQGLWQGQGDPPLSPQGRAQAADLAKRLEIAGVSAIVTSDLARARETAGIVAAELGLGMHLEPRLRELDVGCWSGLSRAEIARRWPEDLARFRDGDEDLRPGGGESWRELRTRAVQALGDVAAAHPAARVAVVTHAGLVRSVVPGTRLSYTMWCLLEATQLPEARG